MSNWKKSPFRSPVEMRDRWPIVQDLLDPWAGDECFYPFDQSRLHQSLLNKEDLEQYIQERIQQNTSIKLVHDGAPLQTCRQPCEQELLANITEDWVPDIGLFVQERVLGPFAPHHPFQILCGAILCFSPLLKHGITPAGRFADLRNNKRSASIGIQAKAPSMIWHIDQHQKATPLLPLGSAYIPTSPIHNVAANSLIIARISPTSKGWSAHCILPIPTVGKKYIWNRLFLEWLEFQRCNKRIFWEDILRYRSELLYRSALEYCFVYAQEETKKCWDSYFSHVVQENSLHSHQTSIGER